MTAFLNYLKTIPSWFWVALVSIGIACGLFYTGMKIQKNTDASKQAMRDSTAVHNEKITYVPYTVYLPSPNPTKPIKGKVIHDTTIVIVAVSDSEKTPPYEVTYVDKVDSIIATAYPADTTIAFFIIRKPQVLQVPQVTVTLPPEEIPWYSTGTAKVVEAIIGTTLIYTAPHSSGITQLGMTIGGVGMITISFAL